MIELELAKWISWGNCQELKIYEFDSSSGDERELVDDKTLSLAFSKTHTSRRLVLFVDIVDKPIDLLGNSSVTKVVMNNVTDNGSAQAHSSMEHHDLIDWDNLDIIHIPDEHICVVVTLMDEDAMYEFFGLAAEDERVQEEKMAAEQEGDADIDLEGAELPVDELIPREDTALDTSPATITRR